MSICREFSSRAIAPLLCLLLTAVPAHAAEVQDGKLMVNGQWVFLKTAVPLDKLNSLVNHIHEVHLL